MERWYVLRTVEKKEQEAQQLLMRAVSRAYWSQCRVLRKVKVFRSGGVLHLVQDVLFPGYLFVRTGSPKELAAELRKSREFPQFLGAWIPGTWEMSSVLDGSMITAVEPCDLRFLQDICGEELQHAMGVTRIVLDEDNRIVGAEGVLSQYLDRIVKLNLHKRFAIVEVSLFNRVQPILFGVSLEQDRMGKMVAV